MISMAAIMMVFFITYWPCIVSTKGNFANIKSGKMKKVSKVPSMCRKSKTNTGFKSLPKINEIPIKLSKMASVTVQMGGDIT